jgi:hypothetical protein
MRTFVIDTSVEFVNHRGEMDTLPYLFEDIEAESQNAAVAQARQRAKDAFIEEKGFAPEIDKINVEEIDGVRQPGFEYVTVAAVPNGNGKTT